MRVEIIKNYALENFPDNKILKFALEVEQVTTKKKSNLILNVDGCIAVCFVDLMRSCGAFTDEEADELVANGCLNGLFVLGRSMGFIGHFLDQRRLKQGLYRHPTEVRRSKSRSVKLEKRFSSARRTVLTLPFVFTSADNV